MFTQRSFGFLIAVVTCVASVEAHTPVEFLEVLQGEPSTLIEHGIELKTIYDRERVATELEGPRHFSLAVGCLGRKTKEEKAYLTWYKIVGGEKEDPRDIAVLDLIRGAESPPVKIQSAEYFLTPAQRITNGPPSRIPGGLDRYKAYRILDASPQEIDVNLTESAGPAKRWVGKPIYLCVAAEEWHHEEYFPASHPRDGFMVYELDPQQHSGQFSLIDQFGLNQIGTSDSRWLCVRATLLTKSAD